MVKGLQAIQAITMTDRVLPMTRVVRKGPSPRDQVGTCRILSSRNKIPGVIISSVVHRHLLVVTKQHSAILILAPYPPPPPRQSTYLHNETKICVPSIHVIVTFKI